MCGRCHLHLSIEEIGRQLEGINYDGGLEYSRGYNLSPARDFPVIVDIDHWDMISRNILNNSKSSSQKVNLTRLITAERERNIGNGVKVKKEGIVSADLLDKENKLQDNLNDMEKEIKPFGKIVMMKWGLKFNTINNKNDKKIPVPINVRDDTLMDKNKTSFNHLKRKKRCLIIIQGFYEWKRNNSSKLVDNIPYYSKLKDSPLLLVGGLYDYSLDTNEKASPTFAMITTEANESFSKIHHRMPLIFDPIKDMDKIKLWLKHPEFDDKVVRLIKPYNEELLSYQVGNKVNTAKVDSPELIKPAKTKRVNTLDSFLVKKEKKTK